MPEFIVNHQNFVQRQIAFLAEDEQARSEKITAFCVCSLSTDGCACSRRRPRHGSRRCRASTTGLSSKAPDPDDGPSSSSGRTGLVSFANPLIAHRHVPQLLEALD